MTSPLPALRPLRLTKEGTERLIIEWSDGHRGVYTWGHLRKNCPCASCRAEAERPPDPFRILKPEEVGHGPIRPTAMTPVGHYAYKFTWNDGHDLGIYSLEQLRELCECEQCKK